MSRSAPASPFKEDDEDDRVPRQSATHSTSVFLPVKSSGQPAHPASDPSQNPNPSQRFITSNSSSSYTSSSSYSAPSSPSGVRRVIICNPPLIHPPAAVAGGAAQSLPSASCLIFNHPQLQRLREESGSGGSSSNNNSNPINRRISLCRFSLSQSCRPSSAIPVITSRSSSPVLIRDLITNTSSSYPNPRSRSFSQSFANFSQSFPTFGHPIRSSTICVSFSPGIAGPASSSITVRRTRTDPSFSFKSSGAGSSGSNRITATIGNVIDDMNLNRQQSAPGRAPPASPRPSDAWNGAAGSSSRQLSIEMPQRPASASPTAMPHKMRLVPIMQPVEASNDDNDPFVRPSKQQQQSVKVNPAATSSKSDYPNQVFTSQQSQANYIQSLLEHQHKRLQLLEEQMNRMEYNVNVKRASIKLRERDLFKRLLSQTCGKSDVATSNQLETLMRTLEDVRELKVSIICYVTEIDHHGDHYLGDLDLRKVVASSSSRRALPAITAPPIPPRLVKPVEKPYSILEMRVPTSVACASGTPAPRRMASTDSSNTLRPTDEGAGFQRSTSQGYSSMQAPEDHASRRLADGKKGEEDDEDDHWLCTSCTFQNHPGLNMCEVCEKPKDHYVPQTASPIASPGNNNDSDAAPATADTTNSILLTPPENESIVNFVYLTHDLLNRPFLLIPVPLNFSSATSSPHDILSALSSLSNQLNLILPSNVTTATAAATRSLSSQQTTTDDANANINANDNESRNNDLIDNSNSSHCFISLLPSPSTSHTCNSNGSCNCCCCTHNKQQ